MGDLFLIIALASSYLGLSGVRGLFLLVAVGVKRALLPFSSWLPLAMKAPTPVSALVHSSTLVTAGVLLRSKFYINLSVLLLVSLRTLLVSSFSALREIDLKKVVALSTIRQIGLLGALIRVGGGPLFYHHLALHAFMKSLLFVCVGGNIVSSGGDQAGLGFSSNPAYQVTLLATGAGLSGLL